MKIILFLAFFCKAKSPNVLSSRGELARHMTQPQLYFYFTEGWKSVLYIPLAQENLVQGTAILYRLPLLRLFHIYSSSLGRVWWAFSHLHVLQEFHLCRNIPQDVIEVVKWPDCFFSKCGFYIFSSSFLNLMGVVHVWGGLPFLSNITFICYCWYLQSTL